MLKKSFFVCKEKALLAFLVSIIVYILLFFFFKCNLISISFTIRVIYVILSFILFMMLSKVDQYIDDFLYKSTRDFLTLISIISFLGISLITDGYMLYAAHNYIYTSIYTIIFIGTLFNYTICKYEINKYMHKNMIWLAGIVFIFILCIGMKSHSDSRVLFIWKMLCVFIEIILYVHICRILKLQAQLNKMWLKIEFFYAVILFSLEFINIVWDKFDIIYILLENIGLINFLMVFMFTIKNQIKHPYEVLIKILKQENDELDELNKQILYKNEELEKLNIILKQKEELNHAFFRFMPHPIIILNSKNKRITFANKRFLDIAEIDDPKEIINKKIKKYIEFIADLDESDFDAILYVGEKRKYLKTRFLANYSWDYKKLILIEDNTEKVQIREMKNEVEKRKHNEYIRTQFLSSISHDLKTPVNVIYSGLQLEQIFVEKSDLESLKKYNAICRQNCILLITFANNLIDNSKIISDYIAADLKKVNLVEVVEEHVMTYVEYAKWNGIELIFDTNTEECMVEIDAEFMGRIILNLISNGVKYTPENGKIFVTIEERKESVVINVRDTGCGVKKEIRDMIFNRYTSSNESIADSKSGTGLGLFVVKRLVELQNGYIYLDDTVSIGTSIIIEFKRGEVYA